ncbi:YceI family protein [Ralstonia insidiosa]|jgi:polyisoprenoid-binding protein YceI|uniref:YceI family protein n=1 Tax=Ralstonia TaxID=48736 RepID=UPI000664B45E|nr:YceI family protein [Ralstonia insidiosa]KMW47385.1 polyisoprenoid-binding protein [Ralstonia sp. MD27]MBX3773632.1 YceI family protein [Ralstonia pickettii]NOZ98706.1 YceI family protein [Betaproteobacteria bacterium]MBA9857587.1 polyisoprenoid-binding protein [Ralstonia insidiosa]MBA9870918.1 polyisoprenoid-binding protein [Ralstonia insidiosa]
MKRFVRPRAIALVAAGALSIAAVSVSVSAMAQVDAAKSSVTATGKQLGVPMDIKFGKFDAAVNYNPANVAASTAKVDIDINSVDVGSKEYNDELKKKDWFNAAQYPKATFVSSAFKPGANGKVDVVGKLTIKGVTQDVTAPFTFKQEGANQIFEGALPVKRNAFKVGDGEWKDTSVVADDVTIKFRVVIAKK